MALRKPASWNLLEQLWDRNDLEELFEICSFSSKATQLVNTKKVDPHTVALYFGCLQFQNGKYAEALVHFKNIETETDDEFSKMLVKINLILCGLEAQPNSLHFREAISELNSILEALESSTLSEFSFNLQLLVLFNIGKLTLQLERDNCSTFRIALKKAFLYFKVTREMAQLQGMKSSSFLLQTLANFTNISESDMILFILQETQSQPRVLKECLLEIVSFIIYDWTNHGKELGIQFLNELERFQNPQLSYFYYIYAYSLYLKKDYQDALNQIIKAISMTESFVYIFLQGMIYFQMKKFEQSSGCFRRCSAQRNYRFSDSLNMLGIMESIQGKHWASIEITKHALGLDHVDLNIVYNISLEYRSLKNFSAEFTLLEYCLERRGTSSRDLRASPPYLMHRMAISKLSMNHLDDAIKILKTIDYQTAVIRKDLALVFLLQGLFDQSAEILAEILRSDPYDVVCLYVDAILQLYRSKHDLAIENLKKALKIIQNIAEQQEEGFTEFQVDDQVIEINEDNKKLLDPITRRSIRNHLQNNLAVLNASTNPKEALRLVNLVLDSDEGNVEASANKAQMLLSEGKKAEASFFWLRFRKYSTGSTQGLERVLQDAIDTRKSTKNGGTGSFRTTISERDLLNLDIVLVSFWLVSKKSDPNRKVSLKRTRQESFGNLQVDLTDQ